MDDIKEIVNALHKLELGSIGYQYNSKQLVIQFTNAEYIPILIHYLNTIIYKYFMVIDGDVNMKTRYFIKVEISENINIPNIFD